MKRWISSTTKNSTAPAMPMPNNRPVQRKYLRSPLKKLSATSTMIAAAKTNSNARKYGTAAACYAGTGCRRPAGAAAASSNTTSSYAALSASSARTSWLFSA